MSSLTLRLHKGREGGFKILFGSNVHNMEFHSAYACCLLRIRT